MSDYLAQYDDDSIHNVIRKLEDRIRVLESREITADFLDELTDDIGDAQAGSTGGWILSETTLSSADETTILDSSIPSLALGAVGYLSGTGFWVGQDGSVYKLHLGDPAGSMLKWDGTDLTITGILNALSGHFSGSVQVGTSPYILIDGTNTNIRSGNYSGGTAGFKLDGLTGNAEVNNLTARGEIKSSVFTKGEIATTAGTQGVFKSAGKLRSDVTTVSSPTTFNLDVDDPASGHAVLFAVGDILRLKDGLSDAWVTVSSMSDQTTYYRYVCTLSYGTVGTFKAGMAVVDYGKSGDGYLILTADQTNAPYMSVQTHTGTPWSSTSEVGRFGRLDGIGALSGYGWFVGDVTTSYAYYNTTDGLMLKGKGVSLTKNNISSGEVLEIDTGYSHVVGPDLLINGDITVFGDLVLVG